MNQEHLNANRQMWDARASFHPETEMYDNSAFLQGKSSLMPIELEALGDVSGKRLLHLQCHFGQDTLSWARLGAEATGLDFSGTAIATARSMNERLGLNARFIQANVLELQPELEGQFDIVFTSYGVLIWLNNLAPWAEAVARYLRPGGVFCIVEFHPTLMILDFENNRIGYPYFNDGNPIIEVVKGSYAQPDAPFTHTEYTWQHSLSETLTALLDQGLQLEAFREYPYSPYNCFANMEPAGNGMYRCTGIEAIPHVFMLKMRKK
ncbi:MAG: methyltransferase domain-containing protein [Lewinellaceae bacterium]|nr:methyltransferase domain-containing protein [Lewinellaceae bacterium]